MSEYAVVNKSRLKLKADSGIKNSSPTCPSAPAGGRVGNKLPGIDIAHQAAWISKLLPKEKKRSKDKEKVLEQIAKVEKNTDVESGSFQRLEPVPLTKAEKAFLKMKEKKQMKQIIEKANKTHKQRVEEFNRHLDSLTEHYDIPKVSWTK